MKCFRNPQAGIQGMESGRVKFQAGYSLEFKGPESGASNLPIWKSVTRLRHNSATTPN